MKRYKTLFYGSVGVAQLEVDHRELNDDKAVAWAKRNLPNYWPVYYRAAVHREDSDGIYVMVCSLNSYVAVRRE